ncbi:hypothetical protein VTJ49DRAFT_7215 [Mycothermus thermophilus]|uniref:Uncharacterized protein n=1 Tax=Humicola insolens TaxID=85995 RepID=A0ABR3VPQ6_HUMIN
MGIPAALATVAACGSIVTSLKSSWELRRMIKRKQDAKECEEEAPYVFRRLRRAYYDGLMSAHEYEQWYEKFLVAKVEKDLHALRRIRAHVRILEQGAPVTPSQRSRALEQVKEKQEERRRRHSVSHPRDYDDRPSQRETRGDLAAPLSKAALEYTPRDRQRSQNVQVGARPDQFVPVDRNETYGSSRSSSKNTEKTTSSSSSSSTTRCSSCGNCSSKTDKDGKEKSEKNKSDDEKPASHSPSSKVPSTKPSSSSSSSRTTSRAPSRTASASERPERHRGRSRCRRNESSDSDDERSGNESSEYCYYDDRSRPRHRGRSLSRW